MKSCLAFFFSLCFFIRQHKQHFIQRKIQVYLFIVYFPWQYIDITCNKNMDVYTNYSVVQIWLGKVKSCTWVIKEKKTKNEWINNRILFFILICVLYKHSDCWESRFVQNLNFVKDIYWKRILIFVNFQRCIIWNYIITQ